MGRVNMNQAWVDSIYLSYQSAITAFHYFNGYLKALKDFDIISEEEHTKFSGMNEDAYERFESADHDPDWERE